MGGHDTINGTGFDPNKALASLLRRVEGVITDVGATSRGKPLFSVEAELTDALRKVIPEARFTAADLRDWSTHISS